MYTYKKDEETQIQSAIIYLVNQFLTSGHNSKPLILYSIRVGMCLYKHCVKVEVLLEGFFMTSWKTPILLLMIF